MTSLPPKEISRRRSMEASVAERFGINTPYPGAIVRGKYAARMDRENRFDAARTKFAALLAEAAHGRGKVKDLDRCYRTLRAALVHRDRVKLPRPYLSWAHIAAYLTPMNGAENDVRRSAPPSGRMEDQIRAGRAEELITTG